MYNEAAIHKRSALRIIVIYQRGTVTLNCSSTLSTKSLITIMLRPSYLIVLMVYLRLRCLSTVYLYATFPAFRLISIGKIRICSPIYLFASYLFGNIQFRFYISFCLSLSFSHRLIVIDDILIQCK